jgi:hypothetical protein
LQEGIDDPSSKKLGLFHNHDQDTCTIPSSSSAGFNDPDGTLALGMQLSTFLGTRYGAEICAPCM